MARQWAGRGHTSEKWPASLDHQGSGRLEPRVEKQPPPVMATLSVHWPQSWSTSQIDTLKSHTSTYAVLTLHVLIAQHVIVGRLAFWDASHQQPWSPATPDTGPARLATSFSSAHNPKSSARAGESHDARSEAVSSPSLPAAACGDHHQSASDRVVAPHCCSVIQDNQDDRGKNSSPKRPQPHAQRMRATRASCRPASLPEAAAGAPCHA